MARTATRLPSTMRAARAPVVVPSPCGQDSGLPRHGPRRPRAATRLSPDEPTRRSRNPPLSNGRGASDAARASVRSGLARAQSGAGRRWATSPPARDGFSPATRCRCSCCSPRSGLRSRSRCCSVRSTEQRRPAGPAQHSPAAREKTPGLDCAAARPRRPRGVKTTATRRSCSANGTLPPTPRRIFVPPKKPSSHYAGTASGVLKKPTRARNEAVAGGAPGVPQALWASYPASGPRPSS